VRTNMIRLAVLFSVGMALMIGMMGVPATLASASGLTAPIWTTSPNPNPSSAEQTSLGSVACIGTSFCVAVGSSSGTAGASTLAESWDGSSWSIVPSPNPAGSTNAGLDGVSCVSTSDCLAVGFSGGQSGPTVPLAEIWNGSTWSITPLPGAWSGLNILKGISCSGPTACVAVGARATGPTQNGITPTSTLAEFWNGSSWSLLASVNPPGVATSSFSGVSCSGSNACIAVGSAGSVNGSSTQTLTELWNGASWSIVSSPNVFSYPSSLSGVSCSSTAACTAVGDWSSSSYAKTLVETWNGTRWSIVSSPNAGPPGDAANFLSGVTCVGPTFCTAVGSVEAGGSAFDIPYSLIETWNGTSWVVATPQDLSSPLLGTACTAVMICTAVGGEASPDGSKFSTVVVTYGQVRPSSVVGIGSDRVTAGYREVGSDGSVAAFGLPYLGSLGGAGLNEPVVGLASTPSGNGYWEVAADGGIFTFGDAQFDGSTGSLRLNRPIVGMAATPDGGGYWLVASDGGVFSYGDALFKGTWQQS